MVCCAWAQKQGCRNPGRLVAQATTFCTAAPNICGVSVRNLLIVTLMAPWILRWLLDCCKICGSLHKTHFLHLSLLNMETNIIIWQSYVFSIPILYTRTQNYFLYTVCLLVHDMKYPSELWLCTKEDSLCYSNYIGAGIATILRAGRSGVRMAVGARGFSHLRNVRRLWGPTQSPV